MFKSISSFLLEQADEGYCHSSMEVDGPIFRSLLEELSRQTNNVFSVLDLRDLNYRYFTANLYSIYGAKPGDPLDFAKLIRQTTAQNQGLMVFMNLIRNSLVNLNEDELRSSSIMACGLPIFSLEGAETRLFIHALPISDETVRAGYPRFWLCRLREVSNMIESKGYWLRADVAGRVYHQLHGSTTVVRGDIIPKSQLETLKLWSRGMSADEIAQTNKIHIISVRNQLTNIRKKLRTRDDSFSVQLAMEIFKDW